MTKDDPVNQQFEELSCSGTKKQQQQKPFQIVLVDIAKAAQDEVIHCVRKPLEANLNYVVLSYRWGELQEKLIDTHVGYIASITSFDLHDFFVICRMLRRESDMKNMDYVWVDAICIDQTNYERRKETIYKMTNIYEQAEYILAVPDLHAAHLRKTLTTSKEIMEGTAHYAKDIYFLLHKKIDSFIALEKERLDFYGVPNDPALRKLLTKYTDYLMDGFMKYREHHDVYNPEECLDHIYEMTQPPQNAAASGGGPSGNHQADDNGGSLGDKMEDLHHCNNQFDCPLSFFDAEEVTEDFFGYGTVDEVGRTGDNRLWKQQIITRSTSIRQSMLFLADLIKDWSTRVWVISEFSIAKKKNKANNNLKYWFLHLMPYYKQDMFGEGGELNCFEFNFDDPSHADIQNANSSEQLTEYTRPSSDPVYLKFHQTMIRQLRSQTFLEMMLKSKASRNEDRFHAVLPLFDKYKGTVKSKNSIGDWKIKNMPSVKLKLYEFMDTKDKLNLLFLSFNSRPLNGTSVIPSFATTDLSWDQPVDYFLTLDDNMKYPCNFDLTSPSTMTLHQTTTDDDNDNDNEDDSHVFHYLHLKPIEYYVCNYDDHGPPIVLTRRKTLCERIPLDHPHDTLDLVFIPNFGKAAAAADLDHPVQKPCWIALIGNFKKNIWVFENWQGHVIDTFPSWFDHYPNDNGIGFNIY